MFAARSLVHVETLYCFIELIKSNISILQLCKGNKIFVLVEEKNSTFN